MCQAPLFGPMGEAAAITARDAGGQLSAEESNVAPNEVISRRTAVYGRSRIGSSFRAGSGALELSFQLGRPPWNGQETWRRSQGLTTFATTLLGAAVGPPAARTHDLPGLNAHGHPYCPIPAARGMTNRYSERDSRRVGTRPRRGV